jgi:hypothetical protein
MTIVDYVILTTREAVEGFFEACERVPEDKRNWQPLDCGRSVISQAQEVALCPGWPKALIDKMGFDPTEWDPSKEPVNQMTRLEEIKAVAMENLEKFEAHMRAMPESKYAETMELPWGKKKYTVFETFSFPMWNANYHGGQVNYIQTLYGDTGY